jgi:hypothetical protein
MAQHVTVVLGNGSKSHFHAKDSLMYDPDEGVLVIEDLSGGTVHFNAREFVLAWITTEMGEDEVHDYLQRLEDQKNGIKPEEGEGYGYNGGLGV